MPRYLSVSGLILLLGWLNTAVAQSWNYKVKYGMLQAGHARLDYTADSSHLRSRLNINSASWLSTVWTLADSISSTYDFGLGQLTHHVKVIHEGAYHRYYQADFSRDGQVSINGKSEQLTENDFWDLPSLIYHLAGRSFSGKDTLQFNLWDGRGWGQLVLAVEKVPGSNLRHPFARGGWRLHPISSTDKSRENNIHLELLLADTVPHLPLRILIDTKFGNVVMHLVEP